MSERAMLMQLVDAADGVEPNWDDALRRAGFRGRRLPKRGTPVSPRRVLVLAVLALAVVYVMAALAAGRPRVGPVYWLFDRSGETYPVHQVPRTSGWVERIRGVPWRDYVPTPDGGRYRPRPVPLLQGTVAGHRFEIAALTRWRAVALGFSGGGPAEPLYGTNVPGVGGGSGGFSVRGLPGPVAEGRRFAAPDPESMHWVSLTLDIPQGFEASGGGTGPKWFYGVANLRVARVELVNENDGTVVSVPTLPGPPDYPFRVRVWVAVLRLDQLVHAVVPRDLEGDELERWELPTAL
jgi:hypothetical protein